MANQSVSRSNGRSLAVQEIPPEPRRTDWRDGRTRRGDTEILLEEVRECQSLVHAALLVLVGEERCRHVVSEGSIARANLKRRCRRPDEPIAAEFFPGEGGFELQARWDIQTLRDLVHELTRAQVSSMPGMGKQRMAKLDAAIEEAGLDWVLGNEELV